MASLVLTGDTSGQVTLAAPAVAGTTTLTLPATTGTVLNDATVGVCRAWVNYKGTATRAINASFNVSSVTFNATGDYTINFTTAMTDANYAATFGYQGDSLVVTGNSRVVQIQTQAAGTCRVQTMAQGTGGSLVDFPILNASIFR